MLGAKLLIVEYRRANGSYIVAAIICSIIVDATQVAEIHVGFYTLETMPYGKTHSIIPFS